MAPRLYRGVIDSIWGGLGGSGPEKFALFGSQAYDPLPKMAASGLSQVCFFSGGRSSGDPGLPP